MLNYNHLVDITPDYPFTAGTFPELHRAYWRRIANFCHYVKGRANKKTDMA